MVYHGHSWCFVAGALLLDPCALTGTNPTKPLNLLLIMGALCALVLKNCALQSFATDNFVPFSSPFKYDVLRGLRR